MLRLVLGVLAAAAAILAPIMAVASDDVFVVQRVPVQAQGETATAAKSIAQSQGRRRAADILFRRLTVEDDWTFLPNFARGEPASAGGDPNLGKSAIALSDGGLEALEASFEVYAEKSSATTYRAYITYRFKPDAVRRLLKSARIPYSETQTRKALVLPVLQTDKSSYLWESNNPWMAAWRARPYVNELTPLTAPLGDLEDAASISASQALALDPERLQKLAERYGVSQVIVAHARLRQADGSDQLTVRLVNAFREIAAPAPDVELDPTLVDFQNPEGPVVSGEKGDFSASVGDLLAEAAFNGPTGNFPSLAERAIESVIAKYASSWKSKTLIDHSHEAVLETTAFFDSLADWSKIRAGLLATPLVGSVQVFALSPRGAELRLRVFGDPSRLGVAMENYGVTFWTEGDGRWFLATPGRASQLRGSRALQRKAGFTGDDGVGHDDLAAPKIVPAEQPIEPDAESRLERSN